VLFGGSFEKIPRNIFLVFLNSPCTETSKNARNNMGKTTWNFPHFFGAIFSTYTSIKKFFGAIFSTYTSIKKFFVAFLNSTPEKAIKQIG
jgi:hypothetical protein